MSAPRLAELTFGENVVHFVWNSGVRDFVQTVEAITRFRPKVIARHAILRSVNPVKILRQTRHSPALVMIDAPRKCVIDSTQRCRLPTRR